MHPTELERLISGGETLTVEFKSRRTSQGLDDREFVETLACLANGQGGVLIVGVADSGDIEGCAPWHKTTTDPRRLEALVQNRTSPPLPVVASVVELAGKELVVVEVDASPTPIATINGVYQRRVLRAQGEPACVAMDPAYLFSQYHSAAGRDWASLPAIGATLEHLDPAEFTRLRRLIAQAQSDSPLAGLNDEEIARALGVLDDAANPIKLGGILLFGTAEAIARWVPNHEVLLQVLRGIDVAVNDTMHLPLFAAMERVVALLEPFHQETELSGGLIRIGLSNLPQRAIRESVANALVHRDYTALGSVQVLLDNEEMRVTSPGGLPRPVTLETIFDGSTPRSPLLANAFKVAGLVERTGRGVKIMFEQLLANGHEEPNFIGTSDDSVSVGLPISITQEEFARFVRQWNRNHPGLSVRQLRLLHSLATEGKATLTGLALRLNDDKTRVAHALRDLEVLGLVYRESKAAGYAPGRAYRDILGQRADFVRTKQLDSTRAVQLIEAYVADFGAISRAEAAEVTGLPGQRAYGLLKQLADANRLTREGKGPATRYVRPKTTPNAKPKPAP